MYILSPVSVSIIFIDVLLTLEEITIQDLNHGHSVDFNGKQVATSFFSEWQYNFNSFIAQKTLDVL